MPRISDLAIVLPCEGWDDFPTHHHDPAAASLLNCWTALWHPLFIKAAGRLPMIQPASDTKPVWRTDDSDPSTRPIVVVPAFGGEPLCSEMLMSWSVDCDPVLIEQPADRAAVFLRAAETFEQLRVAAEIVDQEKVHDFLALGYAYLQIQLMTQKLRYSSNLNETDFLKRLVEAADAAAEGKNELTDEKLSGCFDLLLEEKNCYYPVQPQLCDLLLTHENTLGKRLTQELRDAENPISLLITGAAARKLADKNPAAVQAVKELSRRGLICLLGGLENELANELVAGETWINQLELGGATLVDVFDQRPNIFATRKFGLNPATPNILQKFGFTGVVHANFDSGRIPDMGNGIMRWSGDDDEYILAVSEKPMAAADSGTFIRLSMRLGEMIDSVHEATALLTRWPGQTCTALMDLKRISRFTPLLGNFATLEQVFDEASDPGYGQSFGADEYRSPQLANALAAGRVDPISRYTDYWRRHYELESIGRLVLIGTCDRNLLAGDTADLRRELSQALTASERLLTAENPVDDQIDDHIKQLHQKSMRLFNAEATGQVATNAPADPTGTLLINGHSSMRRFKFNPPTGQQRRRGWGRDRDEVLFAVNSDSESTWIVELPQFSRTAANWNAVEPTNAFARDPKLSEGLELQNEFFKVLIDSKSGGIQSLRKHLSRDNLVGQQLSLRLPSDLAAADGVNRYAKMVADEIKTIENRTLTAAIQSRGRLVAGKQDLATFTQTVRLDRGINRIEVSGNVELIKPLTANSRQHYLCSRLAWKSETASVFANLLESQIQVAQQWFGGTQYVSIRDTASVTLLTGGLPYHCRSSRRMLDSVLMIGKESQGRYSFAIAVDENYPAAAAAARQAINEPVPTQSRDTVDSSDRGQWFFHFNRKNILVTHARPIFGSDGVLNGAAFRLKETESRSTELAVKCFRKIQSTDFVGFNGEVISTIDAAPEDAYKINFRVEPLSYFEIRVYFCP